MAIFLLWGFVLWGLVHPRYMSNQVNEWKSWISYNFTWFYIGAFVSQPPLRFKPNSRLITLCPNPEIATGVRTSLGECDASIRAPLSISGSLVSFARITRVASCPGVDGHVSTGSNDHQDPFRYFSPSCSLPPLSTP